MLKTDKAQITAAGPLKVAQANPRYFADGHFQVELTPGTYAVEWYSVNDRETKQAGRLTVECSESLTFEAPFAKTGPVVLYLKQAGRGRG